MNLLIKIPQLLSQINKPYEALQSIWSSLSSQVNWNHSSFPHTLLLEHKFFFTSGRLCPVILLLQMSFLSFFFETCTLSQNSCFTQSLKIFYHNYNYTIIKIIFIGYMPGNLPNALHFTHVTILMLWGENNNYYTYLFCS